LSDTRDEARHHLSSEFPVGLFDFGISDRRLPARRRCCAEHLAAFAHTPGLVCDGDTGDVACDHYRRYADDVALMRELGLSAYRFSISWSRVIPQGAGAVNPAGLAFYDRLTDALLSHGIAPMVTLYHWDLPAALDDRGGWLNPDAANWFAEYAAIVFRKLDDRVKLWTTLNEPWVVTDGGYLHGYWRPATGTCSSTHRHPSAAARSWGGDPGLSQ